MLMQFHEKSWKAMTQTAMVLQEPERAFISPSEAIRDYEQYLQANELDQRTYWLGLIQRERWIIQKIPNNQWLVYDLCKKVYELAEIDRVNFNGASLPDKVTLIQSIIPFADAEALSEGVTEYHLSRQRLGWSMCYLDKGSHYDSASLS